MKHGYRKWRCRCGCGKLAEVYACHLKSGHTNSCGCRKKEFLKARAADLTGKRFGRLTVTGPMGDGYWKCRCSCGNECITYKENLTCGNTKSCGCLQEEKRRENMKKAIHFVDGTCVERIACKRLFANNSTGFTGVYYIGNGKYRSYIGFKNKKYSIGTFTDLKAAVKARKEKEEELFGTFLEEYYASGPESRTAAL